MKKSNKSETVARYFSGQNTSKSSQVVALFAESGEVHNVNLPVFKGQEAITVFCENLHGRTERRLFEVLAIAEGDDFTLVEWKADLTFRPGSKVGPFELAERFSVSLRGVNKFEFDEAGLIKCLRIYHETSTVAQLAQQHAKKA